LGVAGHSLKNLKMELEWIENEVGDKPFGVDLLLPAKFAGSDRGGFDGDQLDERIPEEHKRFLDDLLEQHEVPPLPENVGLAPEFAVGYEQQRDVIELVFSHKISLIASALGPPPPWMIEMGREKNVKVAALAGTVEHARRHVEAGVDIVVAQGYEAGGHTGQVSTMVLVPEVVDAVDPVPVLAAGGIGNGRQVTASLALGAQGVWAGSVWLTTEEAETHPVVKEKFLTATSSDTVRSRSLTGKPARQLRSAWTDAWEDPSNPDPLPMPLQPRLVREARARIARSSHKSDGARALDNYFVGQIVGSMNHVKSVRAVIEELVGEYADTMARLDELVED
jgi:NAD(P)H-dependent flavin oxidoreductase YrpB (nitropropane dioxygenase family)